MSCDNSNAQGDYYEAISDDDSLDNDDGGQSGLSGANIKNETLPFDFEALPFVPKFSSEIRNTVEAAANVVSVGTHELGLVGDWGPSPSQASVPSISQSQMDCPYFPSEQGSKKATSEVVNDFQPQQQLSELVQQEIPSSVEPLSAKDNGNHNTDTGHQAIESEPPPQIEKIAKTPTDDNNVAKQSNWLDENGDPVHGAFDLIASDVKEDPCVSVVNNTRVEYVFHVKEKKVVDSNEESVENVNSQGSEVSCGNIASSSNLSLENTVISGGSITGNVEIEKFDQKKLYEASKNKEEYGAAIEAASSSATARPEEKKLDLTDPKRSERYSRFKRNRFLDQSQSAILEPEDTSQPQPKKTEAEMALESQALTEILREVKQGAQRAKEFGALGWQKSPVPVVNKTFLRNTLVSTLREPYRPPGIRGQRHVGLDGKKTSNQDSHSRSSSSSRSSRSHSRSNSSSSHRSRSHSSSRSRSSHSRRSSRSRGSRSRSRDGRRRKGFPAGSQRGHWPRGGPPDMYYDWQGMEAYAAQYGYPWYGPEAYAMYYEQEWPMDMYYGDPGAWGNYQSYYRGFPPQGRGGRGRGRGYGNRWVDEEVVYSDDEDFSSSSLSPSPSPEDKDQSSRQSSKKHDQEGINSQERLGSEESQRLKVEKRKASKRSKTSGEDKRGTSPASDSGTKDKKKKNKHKKKKHKKLQKDDGNEMESKEGTDNLTPKDGPASTADGNQTVTETVQEKSGNEIAQAKKKLVKKKIKRKATEGDSAANSSAEPLKKKKKLGTGKKKDKASAESKGKGKKTKGKNKVKKKRTDEDAKLEEKLMNADTLSTIGKVHEKNVENVGRCSKDVDGASSQSCSEKNKETLTGSTSLNAGQVQESAGLGENNQNNIVMKGDGKGQYENPLNEGDLSVTRVSSESSDEKKEKTCHTEENLKAIVQSKTVKNEIANEGKQDETLNSEHKGIQNPGIESGLVRENTGNASLTDGKPHEGGDDHHRVKDSPGQKGKKSQPDISNYITCDDKERDQSQRLEQTRSRGEHKVKSNRDRDEKKRSSKTFRDPDELSKDRQSLDHAMRGDKNQNENKIVKRKRAVDPEGSRLSSLERKKKRTDDTKRDKNTKSKDHVNYFNEELSREGERSRHQGSERQQNACDRSASSSRSRDKKRVEDRTEEGRVWFDAREKIKEKKRMRELESQRERVARLQESLMNQDGSQTRHFEDPRKYDKSKTPLRDSIDITKESRMEHSSNDDRSKDISCDSKSVSRHKSKGKPDKSVKTDDKAKIKRSKVDGHKSTQGREDIGSLKEVKRKSDKRDITEGEKIK